MISYAQNLEDVTLLEVFGDKRDGFYVDVGASDPVVRSVTKLFYDAGWRGINIEPVERFHRMLVEARPRDLNLCIAVGSKRSALEFFEFDAEGISTLSREFAEEFIRLGYACRRRSAEVIPLRDVCAEHCPSTPIDFMKIDVEGWEQEVLAGGDWRRFRPSVLVVEATKPNTTGALRAEPNWSTWEPFVLEQGYRLAYFDGLNRFYVARERSELLGRFPSRARCLVRRARRWIRDRLPSAGAKAGA